VGYAAVPGGSTAANATPVQVAGTQAGQIDTVQEKVGAIGRNAKAIALVFIGTHCPISNGYAPEIAATAKRYRAKGAVVALVYANTGVTRAEAEQHAKEYGLAGLPILLDPDQRLADAVGASVTPEVAVLGADHAVRYRGRIDNRYIERAASPRPNGATSHDLRSVLDAVLAGRAVATAQTRAVGCAIERPLRTASGGPTYARDVAPILNANCVSCHQAGEIGPFPLATYEDAKLHAQNIASVASAKIMPPWKPNGMHGQFVGERRLTDAQIAVLSKWVATGAPQGDTTKPVAVAPSHASGWQLGEPDLVLTMPDAYHIPADGPDVWRCFVLPTNLPQDRQVVAIEYRAGNKSVVHHCLGFVDTTGKGRSLDAAEEGAGYTSFGGPGFLPAGDLGGWAPGNMPRFLPDGIGRPLWAKSDMILQVHYHPDGKPEEDQTSVGLYFARKPVTQRLYTLPILAKVNIPAGDAAYETARTIHVPVDADVISVTPHMHLLGRQIAMSATRPDGTTEPLIKIGDWDFNWQDTYTFVHPVHLPKGSEIALSATYDNSADNPRNPNSPPKAVGWGERTTDEMCIGFVSFVTRDTNSALVRMLEGSRRRQSAEAK